MKKTVCYALFVGVCLGASSAVAQETTDGFWFWRWGHMDGPHDSSRALGISRDGKVAVGTTKVVDFYRAWRSDIDWAIATEEDGIPPLYNELQVQEDLGVIAPSQPSAAYAASNMQWDPSYDLSTGDFYDWGGSLPVGGAKIGNIPYAVEWIPEFVPNEDGVDIPTYLAAPDFGGGDTAITAYDVSVYGRYIVGTGANKRGDKGFVVDNTILDADLALPIKFQVSITDPVTLMTLKTSNVQAISAADGGGSDALPLVIAGYGASSTGNRAFVGTVNGLSYVDGVPVAVFETTTILPNIGGGKWAEAYAITETEPGVFVVAGRSDSPKGPQACIWFQADTDSNATTPDTWVVKPLGGLSKKKFNSCATAIAYRPGSAVGDLIVVGWSQSILYPSEAFVWTGDPVLVDAADSSDDGIVGYFLDLEYILTKTGVGELSGFGSEWVLKEATGISFGVDGTRIVGWGTCPEGGEEAWVVTGYPFDELVFVEH